MRDYYKIITLDAAVVLAEGRSCMDGTEGSWSFELDLNDVFLKERVVISMNEHADSAMFRQIRMAAGIDGNPDEKDLFDKLIYMDFNKVFRERINYTNPMARFLTNMSPEEKREAIDLRGAALMENGLALRLSGQSDSKVFYPFDKSGNMSRNGMITFISGDLFDKVDERVRLGIDFSDVDVVPSKYYAYRGLMLSNGKRISGLDPDEEKVIVIDDDINKITADVVTLKADDNGDLRVNSEGLLSLTDEDGSVTVIKDKETEMNSFDGEGIISPAYAQKICSELFGGAGTGSFQIRMPFVKGVVHKVDFSGFVTEQLGDGGPGSLMITDMFGIERDLTKADMILTASMFKGAKWILAEAEKAGGRDPMKLYFERYKRYGHALYITNTSRGFSGVDEVKMNYQFLNTLAIEEDELDEIMENHYREAKAVLEDPEKGRRALLRRQDTSWRDESEGDDEGLRLPAWKYALACNAAFVYDPFIRERLTGMSESMVSDGRTGSINVAGAQGFLSRDLLSFMIHVIRQMKGADADRAIESLERQLMEKDRFYLPGYRCSGRDEDSYCGILRSPHLSRNEQCAMRPFCPDSGSIYERYFGDLTGAIMVPYDSIVPAALSGADFDGDIVKVITDDTVNKAILRGAYEADGGTCRRKYPVADIPSPPGITAKAGERISFDQLRGTFSNKVGYISNAALMIAKHEYREPGKAAEYENWSALCTIAAGLELDSVKTGVRPDLSVIEEKRGKGSDRFVQINSAVRNGLKGKTIKTPFEPQHLVAGVRPIDLLEKYHRKALSGEGSGKKKGSRMISKKGARDLMFGDTSVWADAGDKGCIEDLKRIKGSHQRFLNKRSKVLDELKAEDEDRFLRMAAELLYTRYDMSVDKLAGSGAGIYDALDTAVSECGDQLNDEEKIRSAIGKLQDGWKRWIFSEGYDEKRKMLSEFLDADRLSEMTVEILCDTYDNGYQILKYVLMHLNSQMFGRKQPPALAESMKEIEDDSSAEGYDVKLFNQLCDAYDFKEPLSEWEKEAKKLCREKLSELFDSDMKKAAGLWIGNDSRIDKDHRYFWKWFDSEDIKDLIADGNEGGQEAENA